jgi:Brp/Blh family beta-carotene 15,15'-monooxygenase
MNRFVLIIGSLLLFFDTLKLIPPSLETGLFIGGVLLVGVPHGAADLLVGLQNAKESNRVQTQLTFLSEYLAKLIFFGGTFYFFPAAGILLFLLMAAFHFGETDLSMFGINSFTGKCFVLSYGLMIIGFILLVHLHEASPFLNLLGADRNALIILETNKQLVLSLLLIFFFSTTFVHFLHHPNDAERGDLFLLRLVALLALLYNLPLLLGFFFYFVVWHSVFSLTNIVRYLQKASGARVRTIALTIVLYSMITFAGIAGMSISFQALFTRETMIMIAFGALAVLTAPHMMVMHQMYNHLRKRLY